MRNISVTSHHIKTNNGFTPWFSGTGNALVALLLYFKDKVTPWVNVIGHVSPWKVKIYHISVICHHIITTNGSTPMFSDMRNPLVPLFSSFKVEVRPWVNIIGRVSHQKVKMCHNSVYVLVALVVPPFPLWQNNNDAHSFEMWACRCDISYQMSYQKTLIFSYFFSTPIYAKNIVF